jgi:V/A-type H+-transporting ATPase subunit I
MNRVAVIAPKWLARDVLVNLAVSGNMEIIGDPTPATGPAADALARLQRTVKTTPSSRLQRREPDIRKLEADGAADLLSGEVELERYIDMAVEHGRVVAFVGWVPEADVPALTGQLADVGASVVKLQIPSGQDPPTLQPPRRASRSFRPLMDAYGVLPYSDIDSTGFAAVAFVLMFGMMFGDVGHGAVLTAIGIFLARGIGVRYRSIRPAAPLLIACGISGMAFGFLYGEFFGPTGIIEPLWLSPLDEPLMLFAVAVVFGATLLAISYLLGTVNRWREGGPRSALYASSGLAGASVFVAIAVAVLGMITGVTGWYLLAMLLAGIGLVLLFIGSYSEAGGGGTGVTLAVVSVFAHHE